MKPEFSRPVRIESIGEAWHNVTVEADAAERAALAERFGLLALDHLWADARLRREGDVVVAEGRIKASADQACVATGVAVSAKVDEPFALHFVPANQGAEEDVELDAQEIDTIEYSGGAIDIGEMAAETLALNLDPFPRAPDADAVLRAAGVLSEDEAREAVGPFAALKGLKDKLG